MWAPLLAGIPNYAKGSLFVPDLDDNEKVLKIILYTLKACPENIYIYIYLYMLCQYFAVWLYCMKVVLFSCCKILFDTNQIVYTENKFLPNTSSDWDWGKQ